MISLSVNPGTEFPGQYSVGGFGDARVSVSLGGFYPVGGGEDSAGCGLCVAHQYVEEIGVQLLELHEHRFDCVCASRCEQVEGPNIYFKEKK